MNFTSENTKQRTQLYLVANLIAHYKNCLGLDPKYEVEENKIIFTGHNYELADDLNYLELPDYNHEAKTLYLDRFSEFRISETIRIQDNILRNQYEITLDPILKE